MPEGIYYCMDCVQECKIDSYVFNEEPGLQHRQIKDMVEQIVSESFWLSDFKSSPDHKFFTNDVPQLTSKQEDYLANGDNGMKFPEKYDD